MIHRTFNPALINHLSNTGDVPGMLARYGENFDWSVAMKDCIVLTNGDDACMVFEPRGYREFECTTIFGPTCRGRQAVETGKQIRSWLIPQWADLVFGQVPLDMRSAQWFYRQLGGIAVDRVEGKDSFYTAAPGNVMLELRA